MPTIKTIQSQGIFRYYKLLKSLENNPGLCKKGNTLSLEQVTAVIEGKRVTGNMVSKMQDKRILGIVRRTLIIGKPKDLKGL